MRCSKKREDRNERRKENKIQLKMKLVKIKFAFDEFSVFFSEYLGRPLFRIECEINIQTIEIIKKALPILGIFAWIKKCVS